MRDLAEWCTIDLIEGVQIRRVAGAHADSEKETLLAELFERYPPRWDSPHPASHCWFARGLAAAWGRPAIR